MSPLLLEFHSDAEAAALLPCTGGYVLENAHGEVLAAFTDRDEQDHWLGIAKSSYDEALFSSHPRARGWVTDQLPLVVRLVTCEEYAEAEADGTPWLQREP